MQCPVCEAENPDDVVECGGCGRAIAPDPAGAEVAPLDGLELTRLADHDLAVEVEALPDVEPTQVEAGPGAPLEWTPGELEIELGREPQDGERTTAPPETATCPWCGAASLGALCDSCGRRKARYAAPVPQRQTRSPADTVTCPACFARVPKEVRCTDCGLPFPLQEL
jgi:hypothetical protein